ncbi:MAG TPA: DUF2723 domain-containing protein [Candidatus Aquilonibacter sp.]|nr:DUF2723 domain-containing protein [Candidatus Aquilonibacter sp.]
MIAQAQRERITSVAAAAAPFVLYAVTAHRFVGYWDIGEMDTVPFIAGIGHPPGLALYTMAGFGFSHLLAIGSVAFRMSLLSALCMSLASWCVYAIVRTLSRASIGALAAALLFATGGIAWNIATRADVHAMETACFAAALLLWLRWYERPDPARLYPAAIALGLAVAVHPIALFLLPAIVLLVIARLHETETLPLALAALYALLACALPALYLPLRSAAVTAQHLDPVAALGLPGGAFWDYGHPAVLANLKTLIFAGDVNVGGGLHGYASDAFTLRVDTIVHRVVRQLGIVGLGIAAFGAWQLYRSKRGAAVALIVAAAGPAFFSAGFSDESDPGRYLLPTLLVMSVLAGTAVASIARPRLRAVGTGLLAALVLVALTAFPGRLWEASDRSALNDANAILARTPANAIVVADWILAPPLAYRAYVDRATANRTIVAAWYYEVGDMLPAWTAHRPVYIAGTPEGSVDGFRLERLSTNPDLYRVEREAAQR